MAGPPGRQRQTAPAQGPAVGHPLQSVSKRTLEKPQIVQNNGILSDQA
jgi:hypothetical protein